MNLDPLLHSAGNRRAQPQIATLVLAFVLASAPSPAQDLAEKGRPIFQKHHRAVVTVQIVVKSKLSMSGREGQSNESRQEVTGTVLDPSGLTLVSLSAIDPGQLVQNLMSGDERFKMETEVGEIKLLLPGGAEAPAEVVLRDRDLDLAFIRPKTKPAEPLDSIDMSNSGKAEILDSVISLNRLGNAAGRAWSASVERVSAIVQRPRLFYVPDANMTTSTLGCPAFTLDGKVLGVFVMRAIKGRSATGGMLSSQNPNYTGIILPAEEILKAAKQVPPAAASDASNP